MDCLHNIYLRLNTVLPHNLNSYSIGTLLKENVVALLVNTSRLEFNSRCAIRIFHLCKILQITLWPLGSVRNKYQKFFLRGKGDRCEGLTILLPSSATVLKCKRPCIWCVCDTLYLIDLAWRLKGSSQVSGPLKLMDLAWACTCF